jgi:putative ABC transport system permease protein
MWFISLVFKNVWRRKIRSLLTCSSMAVAVCAVISMLGTAEGYEHSFAALYDARDVDLVVVRAGVTQRVASMLDAGIADRIKAIKGVDMVEGTLVDLHSFPEANLFAVYVFGLPMGTVLAEESKLKEGRKLMPTDRRKVMMGKTLARNLGKKRGDSIEFYGESFEILGVYDSFNLLESNGAVIPLDELQELLGKKNQVTTFLVMLDKKYKNPTEVERVRQEIETMRHPTGRSLNLEVQTTRDHIKTNFETQMLKGLAWISSTVAMLIGFISMLNTMMMSITERIREIATFRAIGWRKLRVMRMIILEALLLSFGGALIGLLLAIPLMEFLTRFSMTSTLVVSHLTLEIVSKGVGMGLLAGLLGAVYPAWIAAQLSPASALRYE